MRTTLFISDTAHNLLTQEATARSSAVGLPITPEQTARAVLYRALRLTPEGEARTDGDIDRLNHPIDVLEVEEHKAHIALLLGSDVGEIERAAKLRALWAFLERLGGEVG